MFEVYKKVMSSIADASVIGVPVTRYAVARKCGMSRPNASDVILRMQEFGAIDEYSREGLPNGKIAIYYSVSILADRDIEVIGVEGVSEWVAHMLCRDDVLHEVNGAIVELMGNGGKVAEVRKMILLKKMQGYVSHTVGACAIKPSKKMVLAADATFQEIKEGLDNMETVR